MSEAKVLVLRTCHEDMTSYNDFVWPKHGYVEAPDWKPTDECGNGLHGWLWGEGSGGLGNWEHDAKWLVVKVDADKVVDLGGKVKFPSGEVVFCGSRLDATNYLVKKAPGKAVIGAAVVAGDYGTATAGDYGTATAGCGGTATAGERGTAIAGHLGMVTAGYGGILCLKHFDGERWRIKTAYVWEDGILPNVMYKLDDGGNFVKA